MPRFLSLRVLTNDYATGEEFDSEATPEMVADLLHRFDGHAIDNMLVEVVTEKGRVQVGLSDGRNGWCSIFFAGESASWYLCATEPPPHGERRFVMSVAGQTETDQWLHWVVPTTVAIRALWYFLLTSNRDPGLMWELLDPALFNPPGQAEPWPARPPTLAQRPTSPAP